MLSSEFSQRSREVLDRIFGSNEARTEGLIHLYKELYALPTLTHTYEVTRELYNYCTRRSFFVNMLAFHEDHVFLARSLGHELGWQLPGSSVRSKEGERFEDAVSRILARDIPDIDMVEFQPIAALEKTYVCEGDQVTHRGLTFISRVRHLNKTAILTNDDIKGRFVSIFDDAEFLRLSEFERKLVEIGRQHVRRRPPGEEDMVDQEIESTRAILKKRKRVHDSWVKPVFRRFSSDILKNRILSYIKPEFYILDVACGDDDFIFQLAEHCKLCVGNDIEWDQIAERSGPTSKRPPNLIFFNHDARHLPFRRQFDFTLCKNLLHHMTVKQDAANLLYSIRRISKRILIVDPEDPKTSIRGRIWNGYYRSVLDDQGEKFFTRDQFETVLKGFFEQDRISFTHVNTIKGCFMFAFIEVAETPRPEIKGLIFDLDGLLVDTEPVFYHALSQVTSSLGIPIKEEDYIRHDLQNGASILEHLQAKGAIQDADDVQKRVYVAYGQLLRKEVMPMDGAVAAIRRLGSEYPLALATSSKREFIDIILTKLGLQAAFHAIVAREDVQNLKPDPECILTAAAKLGLSPQECLLIEDSQRGINAGRAAGLRTIVVPNRMTAGSLQTLQEITLPSLNKLTIEFIRSLSQQPQN